MGGKHVGPIFSVMNMSGNIGAMVFPAVIPWLVKLGAFWELPRSWDLVLFVFAGIYLAGALCWMALNPEGNIVDGG